MAKTKTKAAKGAGRTKGTKAAKGSRGPGRGGRAAAGPRRKAPRAARELAPRV